MSKGKRKVRLKVCSLCGRPAEWYYNGWADENKINCYSCGVEIMQPTGTTLQTLFDRWNKLHRLSEKDTEVFEHNPEY